MSSAARCAAALCLVLGSALCSLPAPAPAAADRDHELLARINQERQDHHLLPLAESAPLAAVAREHALDLAKRGELSHTDRAGHNPRERVEAAGLQGFSLLAENVGRSTVKGARLESIVSGWLQSTSHRENLLNPAFNTTGLAVVDAPGGETFAVQLFATY